MIRTYALLGLAAWSAALACGQPAGDKPVFEVATVKLNNVDQRDSSRSSGDSLTLTAYPMLGLVAFAYDVPFDRIVAPGWMLTERYDISAKFPPGSQREALRLMMQNLLTERFQLAVHHEEKPTTVYALLVGKGGMKLPPSSAGPRESPRCRSEKDHQLTCTGKGLTMTELAQAIPHWLSQNFLGAPVVDQTGTPGTYDFSLTWTMTNRSDDPVEPPGLSLFDALEVQLGLKLEMRKAPLDRLVVDRAERRPSEN
jgi:uncharacterized protein (TIGR03435 family)